MSGGARWRVVYLDHVARLSGGELALANTLPALLPWVDPLVVLGEDGPLADLLRDRGIEVRVLPLDPAVRDTHRDDTRGMVGRTLGSAAYARRLSGLLQAEHADLVHTNSLKAALYGGVAGRLARVPVLWHVRDRIAADYMSPVSVRLVRAAARVLPSRLVANSAVTLATLPVHAQRTVINDGVPTPVLLPAGFRGTETARPFTVAMVGRLAPWKGQHVFLDAFAHAFAGTDARAVVAGAALFGEDAYADGLHDQARTLGIADQVDFVGHVDDVWSVLARADVVAHCSTVPEPFGQVVVEGMAAGLPVVAANAGGPVEVIEDGVDGLLVTSGDPAAYAAAFRRLCDEPNLRRRLGEQASLTAGLYRPEHVAAKLAGVYEEMLGPA